MLVDTILCIVAVLLISLRFLGVVFHKLICYYLSIWLLVRILPCLLRLPFLKESLPFPGGTIFLAPMTHVDSFWKKMGGHHYCRPCIWGTLFLATPLQPVQVRDAFFWPTIYANMVFHWRSLGGRKSIPSEGRKNENNRKKRDEARCWNLLNHRSTSKELVTLSSSLSSRFFQLSNRIREHSWLNN